MVSTNPVFFKFNNINNSCLFTVSAVALFLAILLPYTHGVMCLCAAYPPKICGSDGETYDGWCNFNCAVTNDPTIRLAHVGGCYGYKEGLSVSPVY